MQNHNRIILIFITCLCLTDCATTNAPRGWLTDPENVPKDIYGGWVDVTTRLGSVSGELIAVGPDSIYVAEVGLRSIAVADLREMRVTLYDAGSSLAFGTLGGTVIAFPANGLFFAITGPMWIIGGSIAATARWYDPVYDYPSYDLKTLALFARFPQGLPPSLDRNSIKAKMPK